MTTQTTGAVRDYVDGVRTERDGLRREVARLSRWLAIIDGGDNPCTDKAQLRQWAYEALTLRHEPPGEYLDA